LLEPEVSEIEVLETLTLMHNGIDLSANTAFIIQLTIILLFSTMILGFAIKKLLQVVKG